MIDKLERLLNMTLEYGLIRDSGELALFLLWAAICGSFFTSSTDLPVDGWLFVALLMCTVLGYLLIRALRKPLLGCLVVWWPGYCYTIFFPISYRLESIGIYGRDPLWETVVADKHFKRELKFSYSHCVDDPWNIHVWLDRRGQCAQQSPDSLNGLKVGRSFGMVGKFRMLEAITYMHMFLRFNFWIVLTFSRSPVALIIGGVMIYISSLLHTDHLLIIGFVLLGMDVYSNIYAVASAIILWTATNRIGSYLYYEWWETEWRQKSPSIPDINNYPDGMEASGNSHVFTGQNANSNYSRELFTEDSNIPAPVREAFLEESGLSTTQNKSTGNPHRVAAMIRNYFKYLAPDINDKYEYCVIIGDTFKGWGCRMSGVAIQPKMVDTDAANLKKYTGRPGYGQMVISDHIGTDCGPVNGGVPVWDPKWNVTGVEGAPVWMAHCYDIPVKAMLAIADRNNSDNAYVIMHGCPALFLDNTGRLPWTGQVWTRHENGMIEWRWETTSGILFRSNYRIMYEHFFTEYIQTSPGVYYWSDIVRQVLDGYLIRWTRCDKPPNIMKARTLKCNTPHLKVRLPMATCEPNDMFPTVRHMDTLKMFEEYTHTVTDLDKFRVTARALVDNYQRNQDIKTDYLTANEVAAVWRAEELHRHLSELSRRGRDSDISWRQIFGLERDVKHIGLIADRMIEMLKEQPSKVETFPTLWQASPYLKGMVPVPKRTRMLKLETPPNVQGTMLAQTTLDKKKPLRVTKLHGIGGDLCSQIGHALFGKTRDFGPILPLGIPSKGGSFLSQDGSNLLPTEVEYLIEDQKVIFVVKQKGAVRPVYFSKTQDDNDRPIIVYIDMNDMTAARVHYPERVSSVRVMHILEATKDDLANNNAWIGALGGSPRAYDPHPDTVADYTTSQIMAINKKIIETGDRDGHYRGMLASPVAYIPLIINPGNTPQQIQLVLNSPVYPQYDRNNFVEGSRYPAPHHFYNWTVNQMRRVRRQI